jgi:hypothetical protein
MKRFNYILPMLVGVLAFGNFLWMLKIPYYDLAVGSFFVSIICIGLAKIEFDSMNTPK